MEDRFIRGIISSLYRKGIIILLCGAIGGGALIAEKWYTTDFVVMTDDCYTTDIIKFTDPEAVNVFNEFKYDTLMKTTDNLSSFIKDLDGPSGVNMSRFNANWERMTLKDKIDWLNKNIHIISLQNGVYEIVFDYSASTPKNLSYLKDNNDKVINIFENQSERLVREVKPNANIDSVSRSNVYPQQVELPKEKTLIKYGIIGVVLGMMLALLAIIIKFVGERK